MAAVRGGVNARSPPAPPRGRCGPSRAPGPGMGLVFAKLWSLFGNQGGRGGLRAGPGWVSLSAGLPGSSARPFPAAPSRAASGPVRGGSGGAGGGVGTPRSRLRAQRSAGSFPVRPAESARAELGACGCR